MLVPLLLIGLGSGVPLRGAPAQGASSPEETLVRVTVRDTAGRAIPYALVQPHNRISRAANDSGVAEFKLAPRDTLRFIVRRIGFDAFDGPVTRVAGTNDYTVRLMPLVQSLKATRILAHTNEMLVRNRFYDRMERARRGAYTARFITPEELDMRNPGRISSMLQGETFIKVKLDRNRAILTGRAANCPMSILLDGRRVAGTVEEYYTPEGQQEIAEIGRNMRVNEETATQMFLRSRLSVDELVSAHSVAAIEMYGSMAAVPAELQQNAAKDACGVVVLWTGSRR